MAEMTCTRPGWSPRCSSTRATTSSLRTCGLREVLDGDPGLGGQRCRTLAHPIAQRHGKLRVVEDADAVGIEKPGHPLGIANRRQRPGDHHPVVAGQHPGDPVVVALRQRLAHAAPPATMPRGRLHQTYWFRLRRLRVPNFWFVPATFVICRLLHTRRSSRSFRRYHSSDPRPVVSRWRSAIAVERDGGRTYWAMTGAETDVRTGRDCGSSAITPMRLSVFRF